MAFSGKQAAALAGKGYIGAGGTLIVPVKGKNLPADRHEYHRAHAIRLIDLDHKAEQATLAA